MKESVSIENNFSYIFDYNKKPIFIVKEGESFTVETENNLSGLIKSSKDIPSIKKLKPYSEFEPPKYNPLTGPIYIEGAGRGDLLEVSIEKIIPNEIGYSCVIQGSGNLLDTKKWPELGEAYTKIIRHLPGPSGTTRDGKAIYNENIMWDLAPLIGTIGVCPDFEILSSMTGQFPCGGNWDCRDIKEGSKLYLNCYHKGALLFLGDVHASQGDTEWVWTADEVKAKVTLSCRLIKNKKIPYARIEKKVSIIQLFADKPLENAVHQAIVYLMDWIITDYEMKPRDAYIIISTNPEFRINIYQMIEDPGFKYVVGAEFPKKYLKKLKQVRRREQNEIG